MDLNEFTAVSIILPVQNKASSILLGNALKILLLYTTNNNLNDIIFNTKEFSIVEKLICTISNYNDIRVRKNVAILIARGCKIPEVRVKVEKFRGLEILRQLQDQIL